MVRPFSADGSPPAGKPGFAAGRCSRRQALASLLAITSGLSLAGCALTTPYQLGAASLYPSDIHTVFVPMFESDSFRRHIGERGALGERLTEAVVKEIELKTPYKVVGSPDADSVLSGRITSDTKRVVVESPTDEPREVQINLQVEVVWASRKDGLIRQGAVPLPAAVAEVSQTGDVVPEFGESIITGQQDAIKRLAEQIVALMEQPW